MRIEKYKSSTIIYKSGNPVHDIIIVLLFVLLAGVIATLILSFSIFSIIGFLAIGTLSVGAFFCRRGVEFDVKKNKFREFTSIYFTKGGLWRDLKDFNEITVLTLNKVHTANFGFVSVMDSKTTLRSYDLYLLGNNHWKKEFVQSFDTKGKALQELRYLIEFLDLSYAKYSPKRISKTRRR